MVLQIKTRYLEKEIKMSSVQIAGGDRDCSSAIISAIKACGTDTYSTYTGNMRSGLVATGKYEWKDMSFTAQRGDIYLNEANHTAMCVDDGSGSYGYDALAEFSISETGGIYGAVGDQTGWESHICQYYNYPWDGILHCTDSNLAECSAEVMEHLCNCSNHGYSQGDRWGDGTTEWVDVNGSASSSGSTSGNTSGSSTSSTSSGDVRYRARVGGVWLDEMCNHTDTGGGGDDFAGLLGQPIEYLAIDMSGWYQAKTVDNGWLEAVSGYNTSDLENGCAGDGSPIIAVRCYYETPDPNSTGWLAIEYQAHTAESGWLDAMHDLTDTGGSGDDFAGNGGEWIDGFRAQLVKAN